MENPGPSRSERGQPGGGRGAGRRAAGDGMAHSTRHGMTPDAGTHNTAGHTREGGGTAMAAGLGCVGWGLDLTSKAGGVYN